MKKVLLAIGTLATVLAVIPLFAAFEAHVVNVTARIENALFVPIKSIDFGTVFPQEKLDKTFDVSLSQSFQDETRVDDVYSAEFQNNTMYGYGAVTETKKNTLSTGDMLGVEAIY